MRKITVEITPDGLAVVSGDNKLGFGGEHNAVTLCFSLSDQALLHFCNAQYYRVVIDGNYSDKLYLTQNEICYTVTQSVMNPPSVHAQLIGYTEDDGEPSIIAKSSVAELLVGFSETSKSNVEQDIDVFEKALAICTNSAEQSEVFAKQSAENKIKSEQFANEAQIAFDKANCENLSAQQFAISAEQNKQESKAYAESSKRYFESLLDVSNAIKGTASGETVTLSEVSPLPHDIKVTLTGDVDLGVSLEMGELLGTIEETPDLSVLEKQWVSIDNNGLFEVQDRVVPVDNLSGIYVNIPTFYGVSAGLLITNSTQFYTLYACDASGGQIYCYIRDDICYVSYDGEQVQSFKVANGCKIVGVCCNGEQFSNNALDVYTCTLLSGAKVIRSGKNLLDLTTTKPSHNNDTEYVRNGNSFTLRGNAGSSAFNYDAGRLTFPTISSAKINEIGVPVKKGKTYTVSFDYLLIERGKYSGAIRVIVFKPNLSTFTTNASEFATSVGTVKRFSLRFTADDDTKLGLCFSVNNNYVTISNIQIEEGNKATDFEDYVEPTEYILNQDGSLAVPSLCPTTVLTTDTEGVTINAEYNKDTNKVINNLINAVISLGGNV